MFATRADRGVRASAAPASPLIRCDGPQRSTSPSTASASRGGSSTPAKPTSGSSRDQFLVAARRGRRAAATCGSRFDDGNASDVELALPALRERGLKATFFVVAGRLGTPGFLDAARRAASSRRRDDDRLPRDAASRRGAASTTARCSEELVDAKAILEGVVGAPGHAGRVPVRLLRPPRPAQRCGDRGYRHVYTSDRGTARAGDFLQARNTRRPGRRAPASSTGSRGSTRAPSRALPRRAKLAVKRWR